MFDLRAKQQLNRGYSDGLARGVELVVSPLVLGAVGLLLDGWLGTGRILAIVFGIWGVAGVFVKLKVGYDRQMAVEEAGKPWTRGPATTTSNGPTPPTATDSAGSAA